MAWVAVNYNGQEIISQYSLKRARSSDYEFKRIDVWTSGYDSKFVLPKGSIKKLIGYELTWSDEPVELKESPN